MKTLTIKGNVIEFKFNPPIEETGGISEDFNYLQKPAYGTIWITELIKSDNDIMVRIIIWKVFQELFETWKVQNLDYLQVVVINQEETWIIDDGYSICWMRKEER